MTNKETVITMIKANGKENVIGAMQWIAKSTGAKTKEEMENNFFNFCVKSFDDTIKLGNGSYICEDKTNPVDCFNALFSSNAMANYIKTLA